MDEPARDGQRGREELLAKLSLEDKISLLTGALVRGIQRGGVAARVKHFVANDSEAQRFTVDVRVGERALRELYLAPFESVVRHGRPWAGTRRGCETVQIYASRPDSAVERPVRWLAGFAKAEALPGSEVLADIVVPRRCLAHWDTAARPWAIEPGDFQLHIGRSSRDASLSVTVTTSSGPDTPGGTPGGSRC
jgi:hypothetical protein